VSSVHTIRTAGEPHEVASSADRVARLQLLARDHREGRLSLEAYRKLRASLLDTLDRPHATDSQCTTLPNLAPRPSPVLLPPAPEAPARQIRPSRRWFRVVLIVAAGLLAVAAAAAWRTGFP
jgi:hypothetical protein